MRTAALATVARLHPNDARRAPSSVARWTTRAPTSAPPPPPPPPRSPTRRRCARSRCSSPTERGGGDGGGARARRACGHIRGGDGGSSSRSSSPLPAVLDAAAEALGAMGAHSGELLDALARRYVERATQAEPRRGSPSRACWAPSAQRAAELLNLLLASDRAAAVRAPPPPRSARARRRSACSRSPPRCATRTASVVEAARRALLKLDYAPFARRGEAVARQGPVAPSGKIGGKKMPDVSMLLLLKPDDAPSPTTSRTTPPRRGSSSSTAAAQRRPSTASRRTPTTST